MIALTYGFHPNEYTGPTAKATGGFLEKMGHAVDVVKIPFEKTGWGAALRGESWEEVRSALGLNGENHKYVAIPCANYVFDFHASDESNLNLQNENVSDLDVVHYEEYKNGWIGIIGISWGESTELCNLPNADHIYVLEIPQVYRTASGTFQKSIMRRIYMEDHDPDILLQHSLFWDYFLYVADKRATLEKYPPEILGKKIAEWIDWKVRTEQLERASAVPAY